jgi:7,8-dihydropterin-6-yl-methyl-4-(beta-D-ribofuranosyl)aminobenzene 5'-phosphate synthase
MNLKVLILIGIGILTLTGIGIWFSIQTEKVTPPEISIESEKEEIPEITLISVYDNYQVDPDLKTAWGFGCIINTSTEQILFDTGGDSEILLFNMEKMNIDPRSIDKVIISHIHGDHVGGLEGFLEKNSNVTVFIPASFPNSFRDMITSQGAEFVDISSPRKISNFVYTTGELYGPPKEQSLIINSKKGLIVITGCAHPGVVNIVKKVKELMKKDNVYLVTGGFHHPPIAVVKKFRELGVKKVAPSHCTGDPVREAFAEEYKEDFIEYGVGKTIVIKNS